MTVESVLAHGLKTSVFGSQWNVEHSDNLALLDPDRIKSDLLANRPAAGAAHRFFFATDNQKLYYDTGAAWVEQSTAAAHAATHAGGGADPVTLAQSQVANLAADLAGKEPANANIQAHIASAANPHTVTKAQVGLGNVDNTSDVNKPVSTATQTALGLKANDSAVPHLTGNESIGGTKTFSSAPVFSAGITGVTDGSSAAAGIVGEVGLSTSAVNNPITGGTWQSTSCGFPSLASGRYVLIGGIYMNTAQTPTPSTLMLAGIGVSGTFPTGAINGYDIISGALNAAGYGSVTIPFKYVSISAPTSFALYYQLISGTTATGTLQAAINYIRVG